MFEDPELNIYIYTYIYTYILIGGLEHEFYFSIYWELGMSSSQLTNSIIFQRGRSTTNQRLIELDDGKILTGKPDQFDGKNPWVSG